MKVRNLAIIAIALVSCGFSRAVKNTNPNPTDQKPLKKIIITKPHIATGDLATYEENLNRIEKSPTITREDFGYLLDLLTPDIPTIYGTKKCLFFDTPSAKSILHINTINNLCQKNIVHGNQGNYRYTDTLTQAEAITMLVRTQQNSNTLISPQSLVSTGTSSTARYTPYYTQAQKTLTLPRHFSTQKANEPINTKDALFLLEKNIGSRQALKNKNIIRPTIRQIANNNTHTTLERTLYDIHNQKLTVADDDVTVSLEPYRDTLPDEDIFVSKTCLTLTGCTTHIEFDIAREPGRTRYCGTITYTTSSPYRQKVSEDFCLDQ